ncbi:MAG: DUF2828 family protein [candidate division Zixibacteria bacterium]|nr:DUF2828 family protein [candidate division Zixibacteria bacterium]
MTAKQQLKQKLNEVLMRGQLAAKWCPRKGPKSIELRQHWGQTPKQYRKFIVNMTDVTESLMCNKDWNSINYSQVPSLAHSRYRSAFYKNSEERYKSYVEELKSGETPKVKVNAGAVYPYDVIKSLFSSNSYVGYYGTREDNISKTERDLIIEQWKALENFVGDANILPMIDVSGSMYCEVGGNLTAIQVAVSLGLYTADKNKGKFRDCFLTFSETPELIQVKGNIVQKVEQVKQSNWGMNTNLDAALRKMLSMAVQNKVTNEDMPEILLILSDMQFDRCARFDDGALQLIKRNYEEEGYKSPQIVFWNLNSHSNCPVKFNEKGVSLVSGFSPSIMKSVLAADFEDFTPEAIMLSVIMNERYNY